MALKSEEIRVYIEKESMERIRELGKRLGFDGEEGIRYLNLNVDKKEEKSNEKNNEWTMKTMVLMVLARVVIEAGSSDCSGSNHLL